MPIPAEHRALARDLLDFIDVSPSPWHAVANAEARLVAAGFHQLSESERWKLQPGDRYYLVRGGSSLIAFIVGQDAEAGVRLIGTHTDSPGLRLKPQAAHAADGLLRLGVEVYGGPILATFADRDLGLAGRVNVRTGAGVAARLLNLAEPLVRLPNLAIHMNREVNEQGLKLHKQNELPLLLGIGGEQPGERFANLLAEKLQVAAGDIVNWDLAAYDTQRGAFWGAEQEFVASRQLDNLSSTHAALSALLASGQPQATCLIALFDHEEVGSESATGAGGSFIADTLQRIGIACGLDEEGRHCALARSFMISADMAHAYHPNFPAAYEPNHRVMVNGGPVIKTNVNQRYTTNADSAARFIALCETAGVPYQNYAHRTDLGCGSTIGPIVAARLGLVCVDVGSPMWAMHSIRESAGVSDHAWMIAAMRASFT